MAFIGNGVEYGLHCLLWLVGRNPEPASSRDLADLQGVSPPFVAKLFPKLEKVGIVTASEGLRGGYLLARPPDQISALDVVDAIEGKKLLFDCQEIRGRCALFGGKPPVWSTDGVCAIHAVMLRAERAMRAELARTTLADLARTVGRKAPANVGAEVQNWLSARVVQRKSGQQTLPLKQRFVLMKQLLLIGALISIAGASAAQTTKVTPLLSRDLTDIAGKEGTLLTVEYPPGAVDPLHRHNAHVFVYVLEGAVVMQVKGAVPVTLHSGQTFYESPNDIHLVGRNASTTKPAKFLAFFVKDKGAPILTPVQ